MGRRGRLFSAQPVADRVDRTSIAFYVSMPIELSSLMPK